MMDLQQSAGTRSQQIIDLTWKLLKSAQVEALVYFAGMAVLSITLDLNDLYSGQEESNGSSSLINILGAFMYYFLLVGLVRKNKLHKGQVGAGLVYIGIAILSGLATIIGLILLIIPGIFLMIRWAPAYGYALIDGAGVGASLSRSMAATKGHEWAIFIAFLIPSALYVIGLAALTFGFEEALLIAQISIVVGRINVFWGDGHCDLRATG